MDARSECEPGHVWIRFAPGVVSFDPEYDHGRNHFEVPIEYAEFRDPSLLSTLQSFGVATIATVAPGWRHLHPEDRFDRHGNPADLVDFTDTYRLRFDERWEPGDLIEGLSRVDGISLVECLPRIELQFTPDDDDYGNQWHLHNTGQIVQGDTCDTAYDINAPVAWDLWDEAGTKIAIIDDGIDEDHEDLEGYIDRSLSKSWAQCPGGPLLHWGDYGGHGTWVAGVAAAASDNETGVAGIANLPPSHADSVLVALKFDAGLGVAGGAPALIRDELRNAYLKDISLVAAGGNSANCGIGGCGVGGTCVLYPAAYRDYVFAVSAITCTGEWWESAYQVAGSHIDITAPGGGIYTTGAGNTYSYASGTSLAAPIASGIIALLLGREPALLNEDCYKILRMTAKDIGLDPEEMGVGLVQADSALSLLSSPRKFGHGTWTSYTASKVNERWIEVMNLPAINGTVEEVYDSVWVHVYEIESSGSLKNPFKVPAVWDKAWARERVSTGWKNIDASLNFRYDARRHANWAEFTDLDLENGTGTMRTYTYLAFTDDAETDTLCWQPFRPSSASDGCASTGSFAISHSVIARADVGSRPALEAAGGILSFTSRGLDGTSLVLDLGAPGTYTCRIYDVGGREVKQIFDARTLEGGRHVLTWDGRDDRSHAVPSGVYFARIQESGSASGESAEARLVLVR